jgi:ubiquinone/menaquinone biosynthesis C-methylase UbiE
VAARGFGSAGDAYERGRPSYPAEAVSFLAGELALGPEATVAEVAAGTGKFTRLLVPGGARIVAVEPVAAMHAVLADKVPTAHMVAGAAEALPLARRSVDTVVVAQAFHWFRVAEALAEAARVLRPGGGLAMVWNDRDDSVAWVGELSALIRWDDRPVPSYADVDWVAAVAETGEFGPLEHRQFHLDQHLDTETLVDRVLSTSYIAAGAPAEQAALAVKVRQLVADLEEPFLLSYRTDVFWCHRR